MCEQLCLDHSLAKITHRDVCFLAQSEITSLLTHLLNESSRSAVKLAKRATENTDRQQLTGVTG